jgi:hypothetical protein
MKYEAQDTKQEIKMKRKAGDYGTTEWQALLLSHTLLLGKNRGHAEYVLDVG